MLNIQQISKSFGTYKAVNELTLSVNPGDIYCLLGANGAGKTTTINLCMGFIKPDKGHVYINSLNVQDNPIGSKKYVTYIPENLMLYPRLSGLENLDYFCGLAGKQFSTSQLKDFLVQAGLQSSYASKRISTYSKGMRQKVGIALAIAKASNVLLLDEPTSGLDPVAGHEFANLLVELSQQGTAILMATHDLFRAKETGTRIGIMRSGKLIDEFATSEVDHAKLERIYLDHMFHPQTKVKL